MPKLTSKKYFNDQERFINPKNKYEKIKLEFSILHANKGIYNIQAKLYDDQVREFITGNKISRSKQKLVFDNFFTFDFYFQKEQKLFIILNKNSSSIEINTTAGKIIGSKNCTFIHKYSNDESLIIKAEKLEKEEDLLNIKFILKNDLDSNYFEKNKLYYLISCGNNDIYESAQNTKEGVFDPINIPVNLLQPFYTIHFYNLENELLFSFENSINRIKSNIKTIKRIHKKNGEYFLVYDKSEITKNFTFVDYIKSGVKIALSIGIDFTGSNGNPHDFGSLHSINGPNDYERAITACSKIVGYYDDDQKFPVYGFGAIINAPGCTEASMCFNLNFSDNPDIYTINNVIRTYHDCIENEKLTFSGPTNFAPLINQVISRINNDDLFEYHILMILTDGDIDDLQETTDILVKASFLPLSVIIIGIGNHNFDKMETLDGDEIPLTSSTGEIRKRDLVQFVKFSKYENNEEQLTKEIFAEIPRQIVEFYQFKNLNPEKMQHFIKPSEENNNNFKNDYFNDNKNFEKIEKFIKYSDKNNINIPIPNYDNKNLKPIKSKNFIGSFKENDNKNHLINKMNNFNYNNNIFDKSNEFVERNSYYSKGRTKYGDNFYAKSVESTKYIKSSRRPNSRYNPSIHLSIGSEEVIDNKKDTIRKSYDNTILDSNQNKNFRLNPLYVENKKKIMKNSLEYQNLNINNIDTTEDNKKRKYSINLINSGFNIINNINNNIINTNNNNMHLFNGLRNIENIDFDNLSNNETIKVIINQNEKNNNNNLFI